MTHYSYHIELPPIPQYSFNSSMFAQKYRRLSICIMWTLYNTSVERIMSDTQRITIVLRRPSMVYDYRNNANAPPPPQ